jgi:hypothetical protein
MALGQEPTNNVTPLVGPHSHPYATSSNFILHFGSRLMSMINPTTKMIMTASETEPTTTMASEMASETTIIPIKTVPPPVSPPAASGLIHKEKIDHIPATSIKNTTPLALNTTTRRPNVAPVALSRNGFHEPSSSSDSSDDEVRGTKKRKTTVDTSKDINTPPVTVLGKRKTLANAKRMTPQNKTPAAPKKRTYKKKSPPFTPAASMMTTDATPVEL